MVVVPTIDDFKDTTVMRVIRKVVNYIIATVVPGINTAQSTADSASSTAGTALTTAQSAQTTANTANATANANAQKIQQIITQFNIMVDYVGTDELNTGTAPTKIEE